MSLPCQHGPMRSACDVCLAEALNVRRAEQMNPVLAAALQYSRRGWCVVPLKERSKQPSIDWKAFQTRKPTEDELRGWFKTGRENIALVCGSISGLVVVDLDGQEGIDEAAKLGLRSPLNVVTGKGRHLYYKHPGGLVNNAVRLAPGIDLRADGGYVLLPPSVHPNGHSYAWQGNISSPLNLYKALAEQTRRVLAPVNGQGWLSEAFAGLKEGNRNNTFTKIVGRLHYDGWQPNDIKGFLAPHATACAFPEAELDIIIASITSKPRTTVTRKSNGLTSSVAGGGLQSAAKIMGRPPISWLIDGVVPSGTTLILGGLQGIGKSYVFLDTALELTRPEANTVFGRGEGNVTSILYIDEENGENLLGDRLRALLRHKPNCNLEAIKFVVDGRLSVSDPAGFARFVAYVKECRPKVIFIDSLVQIHNAAENDSIAMTDVFNKLKEIREISGATIFLLHHESKMVYSKEKDKEAPTAGDLRGSNAIAASVETIFTLRERKGLLILYHTKARFAEAKVSMMLSLSKTEGGGTLLSMEGEGEPKNG